MVRDQNPTRERFSRASKQGPTTEKRMHDWNPEGNVLKCFVESNDGGRIYGFPSSARQRFDRDWRVDLALTHQSRRDDRDQVVSN